MNAFSRIRRGTTSLAIAVGFFILSATPGLAEPPTPLGKAKIVSARAIRCERLREETGHSLMKDVYRLYRAPEGHVFLVIHFEFTVEMAPDETGEPRFQFPARDIHLRTDAGKRLRHLGTCSPLGQFDEFGNLDDGIVISDEIEYACAYDPVFVVDPAMKKATLVFGDEERTFDLVDPPVVEIDPSKFLKIEPVKAARVAKVTTELDRTTTYPGTEGIVDELSSEDGQILRLELRVRSTARSDSYDYEQRCHVEGEEILLIDQSGRHYPPVAGTDYHPWYYQPNSFFLSQNGVNKFGPAVETLFYRVPDEKRDFRLMYRGHVVGELPAKDQLDEEPAATQ